MKLMLFREYTLKFSPRMWFGIVVAALGLIATAILLIFFGSTPIVGPVFFSVGIGVYFLGLNITVNGGIAEAERQNIENRETDFRLKNIERIVEQWDLENVAFCAMTPEIKPELREYVEKEMKDSSKSYFETTLDFIKWNTAFAVAAILWFGNYLISATTTLNRFQLAFAVFTLLLFVCSIAWSIGFFYYVSRYFNKYWILCSEWRESLVSEMTGGHASTSVAQDLIDHYQNLPKTAESFDTVLIGQWSLLCLGLGCFVIFIVNAKLQLL